MTQDELRDAPGPPDPPPAIAALRARAAESVAFNRRELIALAVLAAVLLAGAGITYVRARPQSTTAPVPVTPAGTATAIGEPAVLVVHIAGAVRDPGVYRFEDGSRVIDALRAAGGAGRFADLTAVNLARPLTDGEQIVIPRRARHAGPGAPAAASDPASELININTASAEQLEELPGIGPVLAQRIVDHRTAHGPFATPQDLMQVSGIGPKTFESIEPLITV